MMYCIKRLHCFDIACETGFPLKAMPPTYARERTRCLLWRNHYKFCFDSVQTVKSSLLMTEVKMSFRSSVEIYNLHFTQEMARIQVFHFGFYVCKFVVVNEAP